ncbi:DNA methyltransferase, partial [Helicobacter sp.]|uniref:site-specific DNA-methyltransferase n=1 Tax=Helicobacter sp. TaxID=218 RepID=UPI0025C4677F
LPLDTKHFSKETKYKILSVFDDIESILNGELIKADNFQALNSLMPKYQNKVDLIYIDPPFNTGSDFEYRDKFQDSTWLSLMENRLELAREFLSDRGSFYLHLDHNANYRGRELLNAIFGEENFINEIVWFYRRWTAPSKAFQKMHDTLLCFSKNQNHIFNEQYIKLSDSRSKFTSGYNSNTFKKSDGTRGRQLIVENRDIFEKNVAVGKIELSQWDNVVYRKNEGTLAFDVFDIPFLNPQSKERIEFENNLTQKPEALLDRIIKASSNENSIILDFFAGSGTSVATAQKLGRKGLGVEMGEHFYKVILPRLKKVIAGFQSGISKECDYQGSGAFRYYELESYEEALKECEYVLMDSTYTKPSSCHTEQSEVSKESKKDISLVSQAQYDKSTLNMTSLHSTAICKDDESIYPAKDYPKAQKIIDYRKSRKLIKKLNKNETITLDMSGYRKEFDLFHTLANLQGLKIKRLFLDSKGIETCEFDNGDIISLEQIDLHTYPKLKNLIWWE